ncbi:MAG TPA: class I SAM-dependent methyltransferase [Gemmataceae bacterium]|nr:class I SAM-dependent methyltransferase [Gemmataceae bacterium]
MALVDVVLPIREHPLPAEVRTFLREAGRRIDQFQRDCHVPAFVPSDFVRAYAVLQALADADAAPGNLFCEWGSGFGVVACLAALLGFDAHGIEIEPEMVDAARQLADDFGLPVEFVCGSFIPAGSHPSLEAGDGFAWLTTRRSQPEDGWELGPADFDVIFAFPWPDEEQVIAALFDRHAAPGAVFVTYHDGEDFRVRRKVRSRKTRG